MSSTPKHIIFEEEARQHLLKGIKQLTEIVAFTLGPKGRNVGVEKSWGAPTITNDGSTIVKDVALKDQYVNMGVSMGKEVVQKMKETCGDGTTRSLLLLNAMVENGIKLIASGASPIGIKRGIDKAVEAMLTEIDKTAIPVQTDREILSIANVAASGSEEVGSMIAEAIKKVGKNGVITIEEAKGTETTLELVEGMRFDRGYVSAYFCTNSEKMIVELENPQILLLDKKISSIHEILPVLQTIATTGRQLLIVAEDFDGDALSTLVVNRLRGTLKVAAVKSPGFGDRRKAMLEDIAALTGATVISDNGVATEVTPEALGAAEKITITKENTTIINGNGQKDHIDARVRLIENELKSATSSYDKEKLEERKAKLKGAVAVIRVGAMTEIELKPKKQLFEDSLNSTKAAIEDGILPGGCVAFIRASKVINDLKLTGDEEMGAKIVAAACDAPLKQLVTNTGHDGLVVLYEVKQQPTNIGYNVATDKIEDLITAGIVDPAKVIKNALIYAGSVAGIVLISEALIGDAEEDEETA